MGNMIKTRSKKGTEMMRKKNAMLFEEETRIMTQLKTMNFN
jgi:hypothetical protein